MHQQVRTKTTKTGSNSPGPGAMADEGGLVDILTLLRDAGISLRAAGGRDLDEGGIFAFAVDDSANDELIDSAVHVLREAGYHDADKYDVHHCLVEDKRGSLLKCIRDAQENDGAVYEVFVGTPEASGIPVQLTTRAGVGGGAAPV